MEQRPSTSEYSTEQECLDAAETVDCRGLWNVMDAINDLKIGPEAKSALMQNVLTIHATSDNCDHPNGHAETREIFL